jgi:MFS family permease
MPPGHDASLAVPHPVAPRVDRTIWAVLAVAVGAQTAGSFVAQGVYVLVPFWRDALGVTLAGAALAVTAMNAAQIATMVLLGRAIDRHGERAVVTLAMLGMAVAAAGTAMLAEGLVALLVGMALLGGTYAAVQPGGTRAIMRWFPPEHRGLATGFRQAAVPLGTAIAAAALPLLAAAGGWQAAVWAQAAASLLGAALFWTLYREGGAPAAPQGGALPLSALVRTLARTRGFLPVLLAGIAMSAWQFTLTAHAIAFLGEGLALGLATAAAVFAAAQLVGIPGRVLLPWVADRLMPGRRPRALGLVMLASAGVTLAFAALPAGSPLPAVAALMVPLGLFGIGWFPLYILQVAEMAPKGSIASTVSLATTLCMVVMALGPFAFGAVVGGFGFAPAWLLLTAPVLASAIPLLRRGRAVA